MNILRWAVQGPVATVTYSNEQWVVSNPNDGQKKKIENKSYCIQI